MSSRLLPSRLPLFCAFRRATTDTVPDFHDISRFSRTGGTDGANRGTLAAAYKRERWPPRSLTAHAHGSFAFSLVRGPDEFSIRRFFIFLRPSLFLCKTCVFYSFLFSLSLSLFPLGPFRFSLSISCFLSVSVHLSFFLRSFLCLAKYG